MKWNNTVDTVKSSMSGIIQRESSAVPVTYGDDKAFLSTSTSHQKEMEITDLGIARSRSWKETGDYTSPRSTESPSVGQSNNSMDSDSGTTARKPSAYKGSSSILSPGTPGRHSQRTVVNRLYSDDDDSTPSTAANKSTSSTKASLSETKIEVAQSGIARSRSWKETGDYTSPRSTESPSVGQSNNSMDSDSGTTARKPSAYKGSSSILSPGTPGRHSQRTVVNRLYSDDDDSTPSTAANKSTSSTKASLSETKIEVAQSGIARSRSWKETGDYTSPRSTESPSVGQSNNSMDSDSGTTARKPSAYKGSSSILSPGTPGRHSQRTVVNRLYSDDDDSTPSTAANKSTSSTKASLSETKIEVAQSGIARSRSWKETGDYTSPRSTESPSVGQSNNSMDSDSGTTARKPSAYKGSSSILSPGTPGRHSQRTVVNRLHSDDDDSTPSTAANKSTSSTKASLSETKIEVAQSGIARSRSWKETGDYTSPRSTESPSVGQSNNSMDSDSGTTARKPSAYKGSSSILSPGTPGRHSQRTVVNRLYSDDDDSTPSTAANKSTSSTKASLSETKIEVAQSGIARSRSWKETGDYTSPRSTESPSVGQSNNSMDSDSGTTARKPSAYKGSSSILSPGTPGRHSQRTVVNRLHSDDDDSTPSTAANKSTSSTKASLSETKIEVAQSGIARSRSWKETGDYTSPRSTESPSVGQSNNSMDSDSGTTARKPSAYKGSSSILSPGTPCTITGKTLGKICVPSLSMSRQLDQIVHDNEHSTPSMVSNSPSPSTLTSYKKSPNDADRVEACLSVGTTNMVENTRRLLSATDLYDKKDSIVASHDTERLFQEFSEQDFAHFDDNFEVYDPLRNTHLVDSSSHSSLILSPFSDHVSFSNVVTIDVSSETVTAQADANYVTQSNESPQNSSSCDFLPSKDPLHANIFLQAPPDIKFYDENKENNLDIVAHEPLEEKLPPILETSTLSISKDHGKHPDNIFTDFDANFDDFSKSEDEIFLKVDMNHTRGTDMHSTEAGNSHEDTSMLAVDFRSDQLVSTISNDNYLNKKRNEHFEATNQSSSEIISSPSRRNVLSKVSKFESIPSPSSYQSANMSGPTYRSPARVPSNIPNLHADLASCSWKDFRRHILMLADRREWIIPALTRFHPQNGASPLHTSAWKAPTQLTVMLIQILSSVDDSLEVFSSRDRDGNTALHLISANLSGSKGSTISPHADLNLHDTDSSLDLSAFEELLKYSFHLSLSQNNQGDSPMHLLVSSPAARSEFTSVQEEISRAIRLIYDNCPQRDEILFIKDSAGATPLHLAIASGASLAVVSQLLELEPKASMIEDGRGLIPLHYAAALSKVISPSIVRILSRTYEGGIFHKAQSGDIPLQVAISNFMSFPELTSRNNDEEINQIFALLMGPSSPLIDSSNSTQESTLLSTNVDMSTPLHSAALFDCPTHIIEVLMKHPSAVKALPLQNCFGATALHLTCAQASVASSIDRAILLGNEEAASVQDKLGRTALHVSAQNVHSTESIIQFLVQLHPGSLNMKMQRNSVPIQLAIKTKANISVVKALHRFDSSYVSVANKSGNTLLHEAVSHQASLDVVQFLIDENPAALSAKNSFGNLPLHSAVLGQAGNEIVELLLKYWPDAACERNRKNECALHLAVDSKSTEIMMLLMDHSPGCTLVLNEDGMSPIDRARETNLSDDLIKVMMERAGQWGPSAFDTSWVNF